MHLDGHDTIVAVATPQGRGGIGVVRLSGPDAVSIATGLCLLRRPLAAGRARFGYLTDPVSGAVLDEAVVTWFAAPHSYTAEHVVEFSLHGAPVLLEFLVRATLAAGARLAEAGEFTQRAFLAGRIDLTQAEAVHDLVASQTLAQARRAAEQLGGSLSRALAPHKSQLVELIAQLEAGVDFAEDDLDTLPAAEILAELASILTPLERLAATYRTGRLLREGFTLAIVGRPNAGKSSLFNRLLDRERAIVTAQPGTTRDPIAETLNLAGFPVTLVDTAGMRDVPAEAEAEAEGIRRSHAAMAEADLTLHVVDAAAECSTWNSEDDAIRDAAAGRPYLLVRNKMDLLPQPAEPPHSDQPGLWTSAVTGVCIAELRQAILEAAGAQPGLAEAPMLTNLRQHTALAAACDALGRARRAAEVSLPHEILLLDLYEALEQLDTLTGQTTPDDVLGLIFSRFCIGK